MKTNEGSGLRFYSVAVVAANKKRNSKDIEASPIEDMPMFDGEITDNVEDYKGKSPAQQDTEAFDVTVKTTASVKATWLPMGQVHRKTAPDVRRGDYVMLFKFKDADKYYWVELLDKPTIRRLETVVYGLSNERAEGKELTPENMYWMQVSTHDKLIHIRTTKSDKEPFQYDIQLNTKDGIFTFTDDDGNYVFLNSRDRHIRLENKDKSFVELNKRVINISSQDEVNITTKRYTLKASESIAEQTNTHNYSSATFTGNTSGAYSQSAGGYTINSSTMTFNGHHVTNGNSTINGDSAVNGNSYEASSSGGNNNR